MGTLGLRLKIALALLFIGFFPICLLSVFTYHSSRAIISQVMADMITRAAVSRLDVLYAQISESFSRQRSWSALAKIRDGITVEDSELTVSHFLATQKKHYQYTEDLLAFNAEGKLIAASDPSLLATTSARVDEGREWLGRELAGMRIQSAPPEICARVHNDHGNQLVIETISWIWEKGSARNLLGAFVLLSSYIPGQPMSRDDFTLIHDEGLQVICRPDFLTDADLLTLQQKVRDSPSTFFTVQLQNQEYLVGKAARPEVSAFLPGGLLLLNCRSAATTIAPLLTRLQHSLGFMVFLATLGLLVLAYVLTANARYYAQLQETTTSLQNIISSAPSPIIAWNEREEITLINPAGEKLSGYPAEELLGKKAGMLFTNESLYKGLLRRSQNGEHCQSLKMPLTRKDGKAAILLWNSAGLPGQTISSFATVAQGVDISEQLQLQEQLQQSQRIETVGRLSGGIAHDFNNILIAIIGNCELLLDDTSEQDQRRDNITEIQKAARRAADLTKQLLLFSRELTPHLEPFVVNEWLLEVRARLERALPDGITLQFASTGDLEPILGDRRQLARVVRNLIDNSCAAMLRGGIITIHAAMRTLTGEIGTGKSQIPPGRYLRLMVSDTGTGIDPRHLPQVFDPFFTTRDVGQGTGLGLSVAHGVIQQHQGYIFLESELGKGTTVTILLPPLLAHPSH